MQKKILAMLSVLMIVLQPVVMADGEDWLQTGDSAFFSDGGRELLTSNAPDGQYDARKYVIVESPDFEQFPWEVAFSGNLEIKGGEIFVTSASIRLSDNSEFGSPVPDIIRINGNKVAVYFDSNPADSDKTYVRFRPDGDVEVNAPKGEEIWLTFESGFVRKIHQSGGGEIYIKELEGFVVRKGEQNENGVYTVSISPKTIGSGLIISSDPTDNALEIIPSTLEDGTIYVEMKGESCSPTGAVVLGTGFLVKECTIVAVIAVVLYGGYKAYNRFFGVNEDPSARVLGAKDVAKLPSEGAEIQNGNDLEKMYGPLLYKGSKITMAEGLSGAAEKGAATYATWVLTPYVRMRNGPLDVIVEGVNTGDTPIDKNSLSGAGNGNINIKTGDVNNGAKNALTAIFYQDLMKNPDVIRAYERGLPPEEAAAAMASELAAVAAGDKKIGPNSPLYNAGCRPVGNRVYLNLNSGYCSK